MIYGVDNNILCSEKWEQYIYDEWRFLVGMEGYYKHPKPTRDHILRLFHLELVAQIDHDFSAL